MKDFSGFRKYVAGRQMKQYGNAWKKNSSKSNSKADQLIDGIFTGKFLDDGEAAFALYKMGPNSKSYQMLKSRIKEQLINLVLLVDQSYMQSNSSYTFNALLVNRYFYAAQSMIRIGFVSEGEELLKLCLGIARRYRISSVIINASRILRSKAGYKGTLTEYKLYKSNIRQNINIYRAEIESDDMLDEMNISMRKTFSPQDKVKLKIFWKRINFYYRKYNTQLLWINRAKIGYFYFESLADYKKIIKLSHELINFMLANPDRYERARHRDFLTIKTDAFMRLEDYENGEKSAELALKLHSDKSTNSILVFECYIHLCLNACKYSKAFDLYRKAISLQLFNEFQIERKEKWKLFEAYISFVFTESKLKVEPSNLFSEMPVFSKDKGGISITIIIAQIVLLLDEGNFDKLLDRADAFKIYFKRYVNRQIHYRTFLFTKMIETLFRYNFNYEKVEEAAKEFQSHLRDKKGFYKGRIETLEIIPYEVLWEQILLRLKKHERDFVKMPGIKIKPKLKKTEIV
jgi:hypothetical protein